MDRIEAVVVGAGVVGLGIARALALAGREVVVLEATDSIGSETSSRNSEVIHAGIYYPHGSLKARLCVEGKQRLYAYAERCGFAYRRAGKLIVATRPDELAPLEALKAKGEGNGVDDLTIIDGAAARRLEPNLACLAALVSPSTGIVDSHGFMLALRGEAEAHGAMIAFRSPLRRATVCADGIELRVASAGAPDAEDTRLKCRLLVNAAGLSAQAVAHAIDGLDPRHIPPRHLAKGSYFAMRGKAPFARLIYPMPHHGSLGLHYTTDLADQPRFGPDYEEVESIDYDVDASRAALFYEAIRRFYPGLADDSLRPAYAGIRPKVQAPGEPMCDFAMQGIETHGVPGLVNLFGMESPGLTSALAIGDHVADLAARALGERN